MTTAFDLGVSIARHMLDNNPPRTVGNQANLQMYGELAEMVLAAGDGDYLDVGTYNGTSAIVAAKVKQQYNLAGRVICLDDFAWYDKERSVNTEQLEKTQAYFDAYGVADLVDIVIGTTFDTPAEILNRQYAAALIDGNHWYDQPRKDFAIVAPLVTGYVMLDDVDESHPDVMAAVAEAEHDDAWTVCRRSNGCVQFNRKVTNNVPAKRRKKEAKHHA